MSLKEHPWIKMTQEFGGSSITDAKLIKQRSTDFFKLSKTGPCTAYNPFSPFNWNGGQDPLTGQYFKTTTLLQLYDAFITASYDWLKTPGYEPVRLTATEVKKHKHNNTPYNSKTIYESPYKEIATPLFNQAVHHCAAEIIKRDISTKYCGYFGWCGSPTFPTCEGTTGCYGSAFTSYIYNPAASHDNQYIHGDNLVGWKTLADQDYVGWLLDQKYSPYRNYLKDDIVVYNSDGFIKGHILLNCHNPASVFASLGITIRALQTHSKRCVWTLLRNHGFTRPEAWILMHILTMKKEDEPLNICISDYNHTMYVTNGGRVNFANVFNKAPIMHKDLRAWNKNYTHSLDREIFERKGYNPCNAIWDNDKGKRPNRHEAVSRWFINEVGRIVQKKFNIPPARTLGASYNTDYGKTKLNKNWAKENLDTLEQIRGAMDAMRKVLKNEADDTE